jgi:hypothetical protein
MTVNVSMLTLGGVAGHRDLALEGARSAGISTVIRAQSSRAMPCEPMRKLQLIVRRASGGHATCLRAMKNDNRI